jgi:predicted regulator of Ras-like GTPase activity (Roadblock/LC7/MglB family)
LTTERAAGLRIDYLLEKPVAPEQLRQAVDLLLDPIKIMPRPSQREMAAVAAPQPVLTQPAMAPQAPAATSNGPLGQRLSALRAKKQTGALSEGPVAMRLTSARPGISGRSYSDLQIQMMRGALKDLAMEPDVSCALLADISGIVLTHWSRQRDINVTVVAALAAGNTLAMAEISRNLGQRLPGRLVIHEGQDQSIIMATVDDLLLLIAIGPNASLGWARIATLRACEEVQRIAQGT